MQAKFTRAKATLNRQNRVILKHREWLREHHSLLKINNFYSDGKIPIQSPVIDEPTA